MLFDNLPEETNEVREVLVRGPTLDEPSLDALGVHEDGHEGSGQAICQVLDGHRDREELYHRDLVEALFPLQLIDLGDDSGPELDLVLNDRALLEDRYPPHPRWLSSLGNHGLTSGAEPSVKRTTSAGKMSRGSKTDLTPGVRCRRCNQVRRA